MLNVDKALHGAFEELENVKWMEFDKVGVKGADGLDYYYAESELYVIHGKLTGRIMFIEARSPKEAFEKYKEVVSEAMVLVSGGVEEDVE